MKKFIAVLVMAMAVMGAGQASALDCKQLATKFIKAAQQNDYNTLFSMSSRYQGQVQEIRKNYPKYAQDKNISELNEIEKRQLSIKMFTAGSVCKVFETRQWRLDKKTDACTAYIQIEYENNAEAPVITTKLNMFNTKRLKSTVAIISFFGKGYTLDRTEVDDSMTKYWDERL